MHTDEDVFLTPRLLHWEPPHTSMFGSAGYMDPFNTQRLPQVAQKYGLTHRGARRKRMCTALSQQPWKVCWVSVPCFQEGWLHTVYYIPTVSCPLQRCCRNVSSCYKCGLPARPERSQARVLSSVHTMGLLISALDSAGVTNICATWLAPPQLTAQFATLTLEVARCGRTHARVHHLTASCRLSLLQTVPMKGCCICSAEVCLCDGVGKCGTMSGI